MKKPEGCMSQIHEAMTGAVANKKPALSRKWKAFLVWDGRSYEIHLFHYHHLVLRYNLWARKLLFEWWERQADKRGLDSAKVWLNAYHEHTESTGKKKEAK